ncbi:MAG: hypothetical protein OEY36_07095 [Gammaproteobacteria bacterium]|nr:hypothetical protein [Gammaproteobacteria bacterium]
MKNSQSQQDVFNSDYFDQKGLNIHAIFKLSELPAELINPAAAAEANDHDYKQLIVIGHLGQMLWKNLDSVISLSKHPIDEYATASVNNYFKQNHNCRSYKIVYPLSDSHAAVPALQQLGRLAGWHFDSPFKVGVNNIWGSWFAYRAVVLADTDFTETPLLQASSPCDNCQPKYCVTACPAKALDNDELSFQVCIDYRKQADSLCKESCVARVACPIGQPYRYSEQQLAYHYGVSMQTIEALY